MLLGLHSFLGLRGWNIPELIQAGWVQCHMAVGLRSSFPCWLLARCRSQLLEAGCIPLHVAPFFSSSKLATCQVQKGWILLSLWVSLTISTAFCLISLHTLNSDCTDLVPFSPYTRPQALVKRFLEVLKAPQGTHHMYSWDEDWLQSSSSAFKGSCDYMGPTP